MANTLNGQPDQHSSIMDSQAAPSSLFSTKELATIVGEADLVMYLSQVKYVRLPDVDRTDVTGRSSSLCSPGHCLADSSPLHDVSRPLTLLPDISKSY